MSENNSGSLDGAKEKASPQIEEEILGLLDGDLKGRALRFVSHLTANGLTPRQWFGPNYWRIPYGEHYLCGIVVNQDRWRFWFFRGEYSGEFREEFVTAVQDSVRPCVFCEGSCPKGRDITVFGREFADACFQFPIQFENPNNDTLRHIKDLIEYWKGVASRSDSWHVR